MLKDRRHLIATGCFLLLVLLVMILPRGNRERLQRGFLSLVSPFLRTAAGVDRTLRDYKHGVKSIKELEEDNANLTSEVGRLRAENQALRGMEAENLKLKSALGYQSQVPFTLVPARVIGRPVTNWWKTMRVDKGSEQGVTHNAPVVTADGLVGKVIEVASNLSTVLLVTDETCAVAVSVEGSRAAGRQGIIHAVARGERAGDTAQPELRLKFISKYASLQPGQRIITSGSGGVYPPGILVGNVTHFTSGVLAGQAVVEPAVDITLLSDVFVVTGMKGEVGN